MLLIIIISSYPSSNISFIIFFHHLCFFACNGLKYIIIYNFILNHFKFFLFHSLNLFFFFVSFINLIAFKYFYLIIKILRLANFNSHLLIPLVKYLKFQCPTRVFNLLVESFLLMFYSPKHSITILNKFELFKKTRLFIYAHTICA